MEWKCPPPPFYKLGLSFDKAGYALVASKNVFLVVSCRTLITVMSAVYLGHIDMYLASSVMNFKCSEGSVALARI